MCNLDIAWCVDWLHGCCYLVHWLAALVLLFNYECGNSRGDKQPVLVD